MLSLLEHMYTNLGFVREFNINPITLKRWLVSKIPCYGDGYFYAVFLSFFFTSTARYYHATQSAVMPQYVVCPSVRL